MNAADVPDVPLPEPLLKHPPRNPERCRASDVTRQLGTEIVAAGTRHNILRNMAVYQRYQGVCREECESNLLTWYAQQNHELVRTAYRQAEKDIRNIVKWVYSENFGALHSCAPKHTTLCAAQMRFVMQQPNRTCRRLVFLLLLRCRMLCPRISMEDMSKVIGVSRVSISKAMKRLSLMGVISFEEGRRMKTEQNGYQSECRRYCVPHEAGRANDERITVTMRELIFDFERCYHRAMQQLIPDKEIQQTLSKKEWNEYLDTMKGASE